MSLPPVAVGRSSPGRARASGARGSGSAAARQLRNGGGHGRGPFANDEALALWLSSQENLSDEEMARIYSQHYNRQPAQASRGDYLNIDNMGYEELLALCEHIGDVERSRPAASSLAELPTRRATSDDLQEENECAVCCDTYAEGDELRMLPCFHEFHKCCIDKWFLSGHAGAHKCPMCNLEIDL